ncbi:MAG: YifB family Mg chelatase-like AAA ATPase [Burkholderiales bacterium]|nr:YifB family Mg chelatase-like AAA ATPase [Burkholderiales bacterium]
MAVAIVHTRALAGVHAPGVTVEVHVAGGLPGIHVVGLPDTEVRESRDRVRAALQNAKFDVPPRKVTVNLAPADLPKESGRYDLPIALGILAATGQIPAHEFERYEFAGELALTGELRPVRGALAMALSVHREGRAFVLPEHSAREAALVDEATVYGARHLIDVCEHLAARDALPVACAPPPTIGVATLDLVDVRGQAQAKRALEVAAAGGHSLLLAGPPGSGKSMLAQRLPGLLPPLAAAESLEVASIASVAGRFLPETWGQRPFRSPHHTASAAALVGGGGDPRPGEVSLAHHGVLFLDELPEWDRRVLEGLREPLESGVIHISRAARHATFPAQFQLVAAMNPCPCGWQGDASARCLCTGEQVRRYRSRVSGPLLDRIDLRLDVRAVSMADLAAPSNADRAESSAAVRERVAAARARQHARQRKANARLGPAEIALHCAVDAPTQALLGKAMERLAFTARGYHRVLKVARTIADLDGAVTIAPLHVAEALGYRGGDARSG